MFDWRRADLGCDDHVARWRRLADEQVRRRALERLLEVWDRILTDELGERVADIFSRLEILDTALDDFEHRIDVELGIPQH
jgi:hypothetical protein